MMILARNQKIYALLNFSACTASLLL